MVVVVPCGMTSGSFASRAFSSARTLSTSWLGITRSTSALGRAINGVAIASCISSPASRNAGEEMHDAMATPLMALPSADVDLVIPSQDVDRVLAELNAREAKDPEVMPHGTTTTIHALIPNRKMLY